MTAADRAASIARAVLANADYQNPPTFDALTYGAIAVLNGEADRRGISPRDLYAEQIAAARQAHEQARADALADAEAQRVAQSIRGGRP